MKELPKVYEPKSVEKKIYDMWMQGGYFKGKIDPDKKPFSIVMPPPNVTGQLHMGHALDSTLQDIMTRYKRMQGYAALWLPGVDHAGIATQIKVEEVLRKEEGKTRYDLGREKFLERVWEWKEKYGDRIVEQQKSQRNKAKDKERDNKKKEYRDEAFEGKGKKGKKQKNVVEVKKPQNKPEEKKEEQIKQIVIPEVLTIKELADKMKIVPSVIVKKLFLQGKVVTVNQEIDYDTAEEIAMEFDVLCENCLLYTSPSPRDS